MTYRDAIPADAEGIARVHVASWKATYTGLVPQSKLDRLDVEVRTKTWITRLAESDRCTLVAVVDDQVVGFVDAGPARESNADGEVYAIYLHPEYVRRGIGRTLLRRSFEWLLSEGFPTAIIWAFAQNDACRFYEAEGGHLHAKSELVIDEIPLPTVAYTFSLG